MKKEFIQINSRYGEYITPILFKMLRKETTKISKKALDVLDRDILGVVALDSGNFYFEYSVYSYVPNYAIDYIIKFLERKTNLKYLYGKRI